MKCRNIHIRYLKHFALFRLQFLLCLVIIYFYFITSKILTLYKILQHQYDEYTYILPIVYVQ